VATGIYSLEIVQNGQLVDELYWMEPGQARAVLESFGADRSALTLIVAFPDIDRVSYKE